MHVCLSQALTVRGNGGGSAAVLRSMSGTKQHRKQPSVCLDIWHTLACLLVLSYGGLLFCAPQSDLPGTAESNEVQLPC